jgi:vancomycin resistance protein YoaR
LTPEIGGGVSQFATTIFNAAYFAGLDMPEYQAHSLYFSRYPFGREATISTPAPDLKIKNTTDYPFLILTSYNDTSITVSMYSTKNIEVAQVASRSSNRNQCIYVETDRERVYSDGQSKIDTFFALYRPEDGIDCNGNEIPE